MSKRKRPNEYSSPSSRGGHQQRSHLSSSSSKPSESLGSATKKRASNSRFSSNAPSTPLSQNKSRPSTPSSTSHSSAYSSKSENASKERYSIGSGPLSGLNPSQQDLFKQSMRKGRNSRGPDRNRPRMVDSSNKKDDFSHRTDRPHNQSASLTDRPFNNSSSVSRLSRSHDGSHHRRLSSSSHDDYYQRPSMRQHLSSSTSSLPSRLSSSSREERRDDYNHRTASSSSRRPPLSSSPVRSAVAPYYKESASPRQSSSGRAPSSPDNPHQFRFSPLPASLLDDDDEEEEGEVIDRPAELVDDLEDEAFSASSSASLRRSSEKAMNRDRAQRLVSSGSSDVNLTASSTASVVAEAAVASKRQLSSSASVGLALEDLEQKSSIVEEELEKAKRSLAILRGEIEPEEKDKEEENKMSAAIAARVSEAERKALASSAVLAAAALAATPSAYEQTVNSVLASNMVTGQRGLKYSKMSVPESAYKLMDEAREKWSSATSSPPSLSDYEDLLQQADKAAADSSRVFDPSIPLSDQVDGMEEEHALNVAKRIRLHLSRRKRHTAITRARLGHQWRKLFAAWSVQREREESQLYRRYEQRKEQVEQGVYYDSNGLLLDDPSFGNPFPFAYWDDKEAISAAEVAVAARKGGGNKTQGEVTREQKTEKTKEEPANEDEDMNVKSNDEVNVKQEKVEEEKEIKVEKENDAVKTEEVVKKEEDVTQANVNGDVKKEEHVEEQVAQPEKKKEDEESTEVKKEEKSDVALIDATPLNVATASLPKSPSLNRSNSVELRRSSSMSVNSDAAMEQVLADLARAEEAEKVAAADRADSALTAAIAAIGGDEASFRSGTLRPKSLDMEYWKNYICVPPAMELDEHERTKVKFVDENGRVKAPLSESRLQFVARAWTPEEQTLFVKNFLLYPKDFARIAQAVPYRTTADCVKFYYAFKHKFNLKRLLGQYLLRRKSRPKLPASSSSSMARSRSSTAELSQLESNAESAAGNNSSVTDPLTPSSAAAGNDNSAPAAAVASAEDELLAASLGIDSATGGAAAVAGFAAAVAGTIGSPSKFRAKSPSTPNRDGSGGLAASSGSSLRSSTRGLVSASPVPPGGWSDGDRSFFKSALCQAGRDWDMVAFHMGGMKTPAQCKQFYHQHKESESLDSLLTEEELARPERGGEDRPGKRRSVSVLGSRKRRSSSSNVAAPATTTPTKAEKATDGVGVTAATPVSSLASEMAKAGGEETDQVDSEENGKNL